MKQILVVLGLFLSLQLGAQTDSLVVKIDDLNVFEKNELSIIEEKRKLLIEQYRQALQQLEKEKSNKYAWIADKRGVEVSRIAGIKEGEGELIFILKDENGSN